MSQSGGDLTARNASYNGNLGTNGTASFGFNGSWSGSNPTRYWTYGPDGKVYPTWRPPRDPSGCAFGHEHGDDLRTSDLFNTTYWPPFGYTSAKPCWTTWPSPATGTRTTSGTRRSP